MPEHGRHTRAQATGMSSGASTRNSKQLDREQTAGTGVAKMAAMPPRAGDEQRLPLPVDSEMPARTAPNAPPSR